MGTYEITPNINLKNGDEIKVTFSCQDKATMISYYGEYPSILEKTYVVTGLESYVQSIEEISGEEYDKLVTDATSNIWVLGYGNYKDAKYCGNYFYTAKDKPAHGVHFLQWCGLPVGNAICFVFEHPKEIGSDLESQKVYSVIALENLLLDESGKLIYNKHNMWEMFNDYESQDELKKAFIDVYDDIMCCDSNVKFD